MIHHEAYDIRIERLHRAMRQLVTAETRQEVADRITEAAHEILGYPNNVVRLLDEEDRKLLPSPFPRG